jgi:anaerobic magnesium-protoporphyrin IX monomethyl ester cyclase
MMKVLFAVSHIWFSEPLGLMLLNAICKTEGHQTMVIDVKRKSLLQLVQGWQPDVIAYSAMTIDKPFFEKIDRQIREFMTRTGTKLFRIMGGPYPTFSPEVIEVLQLDAICQGEGDRAFPEVLRRLASHRSLEGIPNIALSKNGAAQKELIDDLDRLPFVDREDIYNSSGYLRACGLRSFIASRGCPYHCSYCFNHQFNELFKGCGKIIRRRSVENLLTEIEQVIRHYPPVKLIRFGDDTFVHQVDDWLEEFAEKYVARIKVPFYCLMRPNTLTDDTARLLAKSGCYSIGMSIETGEEYVRNRILKRNISNELIMQAFKTAEKYGMKVFANTMLAIPGTTLQDDFSALEFARQIRPAAPTFGICCPYPGTDLWNEAVSSGILKKDTDVYQNYADHSVLNCYTKKEKETHLRMAYLGTMYCVFPMFLARIIKQLIQSNFSVRLSLWIGSPYMYYRLATRIFPQIIPKTPKTLFLSIRDTLRLWAPVKGFDGRKGDL